MCLYPQISVIMPVYNVEKYLKRCILSVLNQTFSNFELICVDDGANDSSYSILKDFENKDKRIKVIRQENQGLSEARNAGLKKACGEYVYFLDSDDAIQPQTFEICMYFATLHKADLVCFGFKKSDGQSFEGCDFDVEKIKAFESRHPLDFLLAKGPFKISLNVWTKFYKHSLIKDMFFTKGIYYEDGPYSVEVLLCEPKTVVLDAKLYLYTQNMLSISNQKTTLKHIQDYRAVIDKINFLSLKMAHKNDVEYIRRIVFRRYVNNQYKCCLCARENEKRQMLEYFAQSLKHYQKEKIISIKGCGLLKYLKYCFLILKY